MQTNALSYFVQVARMRSFRKAAVDLGVSQPSLSQQIKRFEEELGVSLFNRGPGGTRLTAAGTHLLPYARAMIQSEDALFQEAESLQSVQKGRVRLGVVTMASRMVMEEVAAAFRRQYPGVSLQVTEKGSHEIESDLHLGLLDLGLIGRIKGFAPESALRHKTLQTQRLVVCVPDGHPFCDLTSIDPEMLVGEPLITFGRAFVLHDVFRHVLKGTPNIVYYTNSTETAVRMVNAGVGISIVPSGLAQYRSEMCVQFLPLSSGPTLALDAVWSSTIAPTPAADALLQLIQSVFAKRDSV